MAESFCFSQVSVRLQSKVVSPSRPSAPQFLNTYPSFLFSPKRRTTPVVVVSSVSKSLTTISNTIDSGKDEVQIDFVGGSGYTNDFGKGEIQIHLGGGGENFGGGGENFGGGGGDDQNDGGEESSEESGNKKKGMSLSQKLALSYAALVGVGGLMGYLTSGSQKSLLAGGLSAALLFFLCTQLATKPDLASSIAFGHGALKSYFIFDQGFQGPQQQQPQAFFNQQHHYNVQNFNGQNFLGQNLNGQLFPGSSSNANYNTAEPHANFHQSSAFLATPGSVNDPAWYIDIDSGATNHITSDINNLSLRSNYRGPIVGPSAALLGVMGSCFKNSGKIFPAGVASLVSLVMTGGYLHGIMCSHY